MSKKQPAAAAGVTQLGKQVAQPGTPDEAELERVANPHADTRYVARFTAPEFTCLCPVTGQPDFAHFVIDYVPKAWLIEIKVAEALPGVVPQPRRIPRGLHGDDWQAHRQAHRTILSPHRRLLVSARWNADRRLLAGGNFTGRHLVAGSRSYALQRAGLIARPLLSCVAPVATAASRLAPVMMAAPVTMVAVVMTPSPTAIVAIAPAVAPTTVAPATVMPVTAVIGLLYDTATAGIGYGFHDGDVAANCCGLGASRCET